MPEKGTIGLKVVADLSDVRKKIGGLGRAPLKLKLDEKGFSQPLGRITGKLGEFDKSLEASNARVIAFGASAGAIYAIEKALKSTVSAAINVEKQLADINVILNASTKNLAQFGDKLFSIAATTGQSFQTVATAATELARQGLSVEETLKRTSDALILTRLSGLSAVNSVESLTAAINSFNKTALNSTEIVNKLANVDAAFAVSSADLAEALRRVGSTAADAGVSFDQLVAAVTSAQQTTARGGSVIGNSFKTIFTRLQRPAVLNQLEQLGVKTKTLGEETRPVIGILSDLAKVYDKLGSSQRSQISELIGGVFQINIVKAALSDLGKEYSFYDRALKTSASSTNEAIKRNEELNKTLSALINKTFANLEKVGSRVGEGAFGPAIKTVLGAVNSALDSSDTEKGAKDFGGKMAEGIFKGLGDFLSGPGLVIGGALLIKLFGRLSVTLADAFKTINTNNKATQVRIKLEEQAFNWLAKHPDLLAKIVGGTMSIKEAQKQVVDSIKMSTTALNVQYTAVQKVVSAIMLGGKVSMETGLGAGKIHSGSLKAGGGLVPTRKERDGEKALAAAYGYSAGGVMADNIEGVGRVVYNSREKKVQFPGMSTEAIIPPKQSKAGKTYKKEFNKKHGFDPYSASENMAEGYVPNFAGSLKFKRKKDTYNVSGNVGDILGLHTNEHQGLGSPFWKHMLKSYPDPKSKGKRGSRNSLLEKDDRVTTRVKIGYTRSTDSWREQENEARSVTGSKNPAKGYNKKLLTTKSGYKLPGKFYPTDMASGTYNGFKFQRGDSKRYVDKFAGALTNPNHFYKSTIGKNLRASLMDKKAGRWLKEGKPGAGNRDEIRLGNYLLMTDSTSQLPTGERKKLKSGPSAKHPSGYFQKQHGMTASAMSRAGGAIPNFARRVFDKDAYLQKYADKGLLQSRLDETGARNIAELFDHDVMQAGKKGNLTLINAPPGAGKTSLAVGKTGKGQMTFDSNSVKGGDKSVVVRASQSISSGKNSIMNRAYAPFVDKFISLLPDSEAIRSGRESRNKSGKFMFGRGKKQTSGATTDFDAAAAVLHSAVPFGKHKGLGRGATGDWNMMSGSNFPAAHTVPVATTRGAFSPFTKGHQSVVDQMRKTGMPMSINVSGGIDREADIGWSTKRKRDLIKQTNPDAFVFSSKVPPETFTAPSDMTVKVGNKNIKIKKGDAINTATEGSKMFLGSDRAQQSKTGKSGLFDITEVNRTGADISATKVRQAIAAGDRSAYSSMLGGPTTKFVDENIGDIQKMQGMIGKRNTKKLSGVNSRLSQLWSEMGIPFDPNSRSPMLSAKRKKEFPEQTSEIQRLNSRKKGLGSHKWTKRIFPNLAGGHVPNFASKSDAAVIQTMTQKLFGPKPSVTGFNNPRWMGLLNKPQNRGLLDRYNSLKVESLERAGATQGRAAAITKEVISGKKVNTMFLENIGKPTVKRSQPNISRYGFDPGVVPDIQRTFNTSLDTRWEKLIKGVAFDSFSKIPHKQLSKMGGMKSLMGGLTTRGLTQAPVALGPVRGRVFEEMLSAMSTMVNKNIPETGMEGLDFANRKFKSRYKNLFTQGPAITGLGGQGMEIRSGSISNPHALRKAGFAAGGSLGEAIGRETAAGVPRSAIRIGASSSLASGLNPAGLGVYNTIDEPGGLSQGINMHRASGLDPRKAGIPNFAPFSGSASGSGGMSGRTMAGMAESKRAMSSVTPDLTDEAVDDFLATTKEATTGMQKWQSRALQASFIFPMVSGQLQSMVGTGTKASKYMESFSNGIGVASSFFAIGGPWGLGVGAAVGSFTILDGALTTASSNVLELSKKADESKEQLTKTANALSAYGDGLQRYQEALRTGDAELTVRLQQNLNKQLAEVPAAFRAQVLAAKNATDLQNKLADSLKEMAKKNAQTQFAASLEKTVTGERTGFANKARRSGLGFGAGKGGEWFDVDVFEEIPGAAKKFASELRSTLNFQKLSKDLKAIDFELGNKDILIEKITRAGAGSEVVEGIKDLSSDDIRRLSTEISELALQQQMATEQVQAHKDITEKYAKSVENAARTVKILEERFKTFIVNGQKAAEMLGDQITASDKLIEMRSVLGRGDKLGDAQRSLATRRPFMTEESIAVSEARIGRRKRLDDRNASMANATIENNSQKRNAIISLRTDLLKALETKATRQGQKKDEQGKLVPVMTPQESTKVANFLTASSQALVSGNINTATPGALTSFLPDQLSKEMGGKVRSSELDILKANQTQNQKLDILAEQQKQSRITEEKQLQAQLQQISIQKDIAGAGGMEGFASGQGLDQALDKFSTGMVGMIAGRKRGSLSIAGRGAAMVEGSIQDVTGRPSGNMGLRNMAAAGRAENLNWGMGLMRGGLGSMGFGSAAGNLNAGSANRMAQNQADAFFKTGKPITPIGDKADSGLSLKLQQHSIKSAVTREAYLKNILARLSNPQPILNQTQRAKEQEAEIRENRGDEIDTVLKKIDATFDSFKNFIDQQRSDTGGQLSTWERLLAWVMRATPGPPNEFVPEPPPRSANGYLPNFAGGRRGEKRSIMDSSQYSPTEKSRAIPNRKMVNGQMTYTNHLEKIKNNYGGSGQSAVLTPAMMRGGFADGYVPNFASMSDIEVSDWFKKMRALSDSNLGYGLSINSGFSNADTGFIPGKSEKGFFTKFMDESLSNIDSFMRDNKSSSLSTKQLDKMFATHLKNKITSFANSNTAGFGLRNLPHKWDSGSKVFSTEQLNSVLPEYTTVNSIKDDLMRELKGRLTGKSFKDTLDSLNIKGDGIEKSAPKVKPTDGPTIKIKKPGKKSYPTGKKKRPFFKHEWIPESELPKDTPTSTEPTSTEPTSTDPTKKSPEPKAKGWWGRRWDSAKGAYVNRMRPPGAEGIWRREMFGEGGKERTESRAKAKAKAKIDKAKAIEDELKKLSRGADGLSGAERSAVGGRRAGLGWETSGGYDPTKLKDPSNASKFSKWWQRQIADSGKLRANSRAITFRPDPGFSVSGPDGPNTFLMKGSESTKLRGGARAGRIGGSAAGMATEIALQFALGGKMNEMGLNYDSFGGFAARETASVGISAGVGGLTSLAAGGTFAAGASAAVPAALPFVALGLGYHGMTELNQQAIVSEAVSGLLDGGTPMSKDVMAQKYAQAAMESLAVKQGFITPDEQKKLRAFEKKQGDLRRQGSAVALDQYLKSEGDGGAFDTIGEGFEADPKLRARLKEQVDNGWDEYQAVKKKLSDFRSGKGMSQSEAFKGFKDGVNWDRKDLYESLKLALKVDIHDAANDPYERHGGGAISNKRFSSTIDETFERWAGHATKAVGHDQSSLRGEKRSKNMSDQIERERIYNKQIQDLMDKGDLASLGKAGRMIDAVAPFKGSLDAYKDGMPAVPGAPVPKVKIKPKTDPWWMNATDDDIVKREAKFNDLERGMKFGANKSLYSGEQAKLGKELTQAKEGKWLDSAGFVPKTAGGKSMASVHLGNTGDSSNLMDNTSYKKLMEVAIQDEGGYNAVKEPSHKSHWLINSYLNSLSKGETPFWQNKANGYIPNFASLTPDYSQFSWRNNDNSLNPYDRNFMMSTPGLRGLLNPNQSFGRTFANGLVPSVRASQNRERMQSGRNDVYSRYVDTPKYSGMATFNGSERGREESIVRNHPNPRNAGATPNFASGTEAIGKLEKIMTNLNVQIASLSEKMAQVQSTGEGTQGQAQISMSPLNVNVNHSGRLTTQVEEIQSQISSAVNEAMKQIAPALWRTIKGPATS